VLAPKIKYELLELIKVLYTQAEQTPEPQSTDRKFSFAGSNE